MTFPAEANVHAITYPHHVLRRFSPCLRTTVSSGVLIKGGEAASGERHESRNESEGEKEAVAGEGKKEREVHRR